MNSQFTQPHKIVNVETNKQAIARDFGIKANQVGYLDTKKPVDDYFILYDRATQTSWFKRSAAKGNPVSWTISGSTMTLTMSDAVFTLRQAINVNTVDLLDGDLGAHMVGSKAKFAGAVARTQADKNADFVTVEDFGAIGDGTLHKLSELYPTLAAAQAVYPFITSLEQSIDWAAIQAALNSGVMRVYSNALYKKYFVIDKTLRMTVQGQIIDLNRSEINLNAAIMNIPHLIVQRDNDEQTNACRILNIGFTNVADSTAYQVELNHCAGFVVEGCISYGSEGKRPLGFIKVTRAVVGYIRENTTEGVIEVSVKLSGTGMGINACTDVAIYDNRFVGGKNALNYGNFCEGLFIRRNIFYAQTSWQILIAASSKAEGLMSGKIQENDLDSPTTKDGCIYMQNFGNVQITDNWLANSSLDPMIRLLNTDSVIIQGNQAYPQQTFLADNGINTVTTGNMVIGGTVQIYFGSSADKTSVKDNHLSSATSGGIDIQGHTKTLDVRANTIYTTSSNGGILTAATILPTHTIVDNLGDLGVGTTTSAFVPSSPYSTKVGSRPESISLRKAAGVTTVSVNGVVIYQASDAPSPATFISLGVLPPHAQLDIVFTAGNAPWLNRITN